MSRTRSDALTGELFAGIPAALPQTPGSMDFRRTVAQLVSQALKACPDNRYLVAARMSELADVETTKALLDSYTAESREACNLPMWKAPLVDIATGSRALAEWHVAVLGGRAVWGDDITDADIGRLDRQIREMQDQLRTLKGLQGLQRRVTKGGRRG